MELAGLHFLLYLVVHPSAYSSIDALPNNASAFFLLYNKCTDMSDRHF